VLATPPAIVAWIASGGPTLTTEGWALALISGAVELGYFLLLSAAYRAGDVSTVYPVARGTAPVVAVVAAVVLLGQRLAQPEILGVALVIAGIWLARPPSGRSRSLVLALATGIAIAMYSTLDQVGVHQGPFWLYTWAVFVAIALWLAPFRGSGPVRFALPVGALTLAAYTMVLAALSVAPLALVAPLRETGVVIVAVWGVVRLGERERARLRIAAAATVLVGVAIVAVAAASQ
jgi:drug/metabolite transporter (DMT)-like permease